MSDDFSQICAVTGRKTDAGWALRIAVEEAVKSLVTEAEHAELFEKLAATSSAKAATIRQNIAGASS